MQNCSKLELGDVSGVQTRAAFRREETRQVGKGCSREKDDQLKLVGYVGAVFVQSWSAVGFGNVLGGAMQVCNGSSGVHSKKPLVREKEPSVWANAWGLRANGKSLAK